MPGVSAYNLLLPANADVAGAHQEVVFLADPPAGNQPFYRVGGNNYEFVIALVATFTTDATAGNRVLLVRYRDQDDKEIAQVPPSVGQGPGSSHGYNSLINVSTPSYDGVVAHLSPLPFVLLHPGYTVVLIPFPTVAGDQLSGIGFVIQRYPTGTPASARTVQALPAKV